MLKMLSSWNYMPNPNMLPKSNSLSYDTDVFCANSSGSPPAPPSPLNKYK